MAWNGVDVYQRHTSCKDKGPAAFTPKYILTFTSMYISAIQIGVYRTYMTGSHSKPLHHFLSPSLKLSLETGIDEPVAGLLLFSPSYQIPPPPFLSQPHLLFLHNSITKLFCSFLFLFFISLLGIYTHSLSSRLRFSLLLVL